MMGRKRLRLDEVGGIVMRAEEEHLNLRSQRRRGQWTSLSKTLSVRLQFVVMCRITLCRLVCREVFTDRVFKRSQSP